MNQLDWSVLLGEAGHLLAQGAVVTLELSALSLVLALVLGFLMGVLRWSAVGVSPDLICLWTIASNRFSGALPSAFAQAACSPAISPSGVSCRRVVCSCK